MDLPLDVSCQPGSAGTTLLSLEAGTEHQYDRRMTVVQLEVPDEATAAWLRAHQAEFTGWASRQAARGAAEWSPQLRNTFRDEVRDRLSRARTPEQEVARLAAIDRLRALATGPTP